MLTRAPGPNVQDAAALFAPLQGLAHVGVAVSGGPDSLALMVLMAGWARAAGKTLTVYTVDHGLRPEAAAEAQMVAREAARRGLSCRILSWTGDKPKTGVQAAARQARYKLMADAMRADGAEVLVTAHHLGDQAETVLMRLAHGSGMSGLAGMALWGELAGVRIFRPLLQTDPAALRAVLANEGLVPASDPSNEDDAYERVRWRKLLPVLSEEGLSPERLSAFARRMARADAALAEATDTALKQLVEIDRFGVAHLPVSAFLALSDEVALRLLGRVAVWAGGGETRFRLSPLEAAFDRLKANQAGFATTFGGAVVERTEKSVRIFREAGRMPHLPPISLHEGLRFAWDNRFTFSCDKNLCAGLSVQAVGETVTRADVEALCGPVSTPMRAISAAPAILNASGELVCIGASEAAVQMGVNVVVAYNETKPPPNGHSPQWQNVG